MTEIIEAVDADVPSLSVPVTFSGQTHTFTLPHDAVVDDLTMACEEYWGNSDDNDTNNSNAYDWTGHKFLGPPPIGLLKGSEDHAKPLQPLLLEAAAKTKTKTGQNNKKNKPIVLRLLASPASQVRDLRAAADYQRRREAARQRHRQHAVRAAPSSSSSSSFSSQYTFDTLRPLPHMPHPERSMAFLAKLRDDVGVRTAMQTHRFRVGLLTEMDPAHYTDATHEGTTRTLGLNRNHGQVIELRLRTDAGDGYRDYRTVRRTLCHELAHNVFGDHDRDFWTLCHQLEREVERADYHKSGRTIGGGDHDVVYEAPPRYTDEDNHGEEEDHVDAGGWTGGTYVLGGDSTTTTTTSTSSTSTARRDLMARAAEERMRRMAADKSQDSSGSESNRQNP